MDDKSRVYPSVVLDPLPAVDSDARAVVPQKHGGSLRPFRKGESGNVSGRPARKHVTDVYAKMWDMGPVELVDYKPTSTGEAVVRRLLLDAYKEGNKLPEVIMALREIADRLEGKAPQPVEHSGPRKGAIRVRLEIGKMGVKSAIQDPDDDEGTEQADETGRDEDNE